MNGILTTRVSPIHISFPFHRRPRLTVSVWRRFRPEAEQNVLSIEVTNVGSEPVEVTGVYVGFLHAFLPAELLLGKRAIRFPLHNLTGAPGPPYVLDNGSVRWTASLDQVKEQLVAEQLRYWPHLRQVYAELVDIRWPHLDQLYTELADIDLTLNRGPRGRLAITANNVSRQLRSRRLAVVVQDAQGGLYKAKARWEPLWRQAPRPR